MHVTLYLVPLLLTTLGSCLLPPICRAPSHFSGFGTLGVAHSDYRDVDFPRQPGTVGRAGQDTQDRCRADSVFGAQADIRQATIQGNGASRCAAHVGRCVQTVFSNTPSYRLASIWKPAGRSGADVHDFRRTHDRLQPVSGAGTGNS